MVSYFQVINTPFTFNICISLLRIHPPIIFNEPSKLWHLESISDHRINYQEKNSSALNLLYVVSLTEGMKKKKKKKMCFVSLYEMCMIICVYGFVFRWAIFIWYKKW